MPVSIDPTDRFVSRHIGPADSDIRAMLQVVGAASLDELIDQTIPATHPPAQAARPPGRRRPSTICSSSAHGIASKNEVWRSYLGMGYADCITPPVIQRNVLENPGWYTQYTPYQAEIAQGRLEALLNFQTMVSDLTALADRQRLAARRGDRRRRGDAHDGVVALERRAARRFFVSEQCHPQTIEVVRTRAVAHGIEVVVGDASAAFDGAGKKLVRRAPPVPGDRRRARRLARLSSSAPTPRARWSRWRAISSRWRSSCRPASSGADIAVGSAQRFGVPLGYGGPHAAFFACKNEHVRKLPGRIIGVSVDAHGKRALRMALQTREQHIRREKATSNVCTAQALLAVVASMYAVYHGPARHPRHRRARARARGGARARAPASSACASCTTRFFDTVRVEGDRRRDVDAWIGAARARQMNLRRIDERSLGIALDETTSAADVDALLAVFHGGRAPRAPAASELAREASPALAGFERTSAYLTHPVFNTHHSETEMLRYMRIARVARPLARALDDPARLVHDEAQRDGRDDADHVGALQSRSTPSRRLDQAQGYQVIVKQLEAMLGRDHRLPRGQPAAQLRRAGRARGAPRHPQVPREPRRASSATCASSRRARTGPTPRRRRWRGCASSSSLATRRATSTSAISRRRPRSTRSDLAALMVTYPSTYGIFEEEIERICAIVHEHGGQVYLDGANLNAQVGLCRPADVGADVCHVNLHKTFCIPHGGGGPGMGPIGVGAAPREVPAAAPGRRRSAASEGIGAGQRGAVGEREHPAHLVGVHRDDGRRGAEARERGRHPQRELRRRAPAPALPGVLPGQARARRARVHPRHARREAHGRHRGRRHRQAPHGLRLPRADDELPHRRAR